MDDFTTKHPADARPDELTHGQRITRQLMPEMAALQDQKLCIMCQKPKPPEEQATWSEAGRREWNISGMCEPCFDGAFAEPDEITFYFTYIQQYRTPEALAADAASTERTYGDHCYFGGGLLVRDASEVMFVLQHGENTSTDETTCKPCLDRVMTALVKESLDSAITNGYDIEDWGAEGIAEDMGSYDGTVDQLPVKFLVPYVEAWLEERRIARAESGADREV